MSVFRPVRGMRDFLPEGARRMRQVEGVARELARLYGYREVITPVVESYDLLAAKAGEENRKRMYAFEDLGGRRVALRPEFTPSIARLVAPRVMREPKPMRLFCTGSLYRYDEPQHGRYREFWSSNFELVGSGEPEADAEVLTLTHEMMERLGLRRYHFKVGHMGILRGILSREGVGEEEQNRLMGLLDKQLWDEALTTARGLGVSGDGLTTMRGIFNAKGRDIPEVLRRVRDLAPGCEGVAESAENLEEILELAREGGAEFDVWVEAGFARGLEYYTGMIFEVYVPEMNIALGGGGRYDRLVELFGGEATPAVGVGHGIDRLVLAMEKQGLFTEAQESRRVAVIAVRRELRAQSLKVSLTLRRSGIPAEVEVMGRGVSAALSDAERRGFTHAVILGPEEAKEGKVVLRDMKKREQRPIDVKGIAREVLSEEGTAPRP